MKLYLRLDDARKEEIYKLLLQNGAKESPVCCNDTSLSKGAYTLIKA